MLLLAFWIGWNTTDIMEIHAPFHARFRSFFRFMLSRCGAEDAMIPIQDFPDRACGTRQNDTCLCEIGLLLQVIQDGEGTGGSSQLLRWMVSDLQDPIHNLRGYLRWRVFPSARLALQDLPIF